MVVNSSTDTGQAGEGLRYMGLGCVIGLQAGEYGVRPMGRLWVTGLICKFGCTPHGPVGKPCSEAVSTRMRQQSGPSNWWSAMIQNLQN